SSGAVPPVAGRAALLDVFVRQLLTAARGSLDELCADLAATSAAGAEISVWLDDRLTDLVEIAAEGWLASRDPVGAVVAWSRVAAPVPVLEIVPDWPLRIRQILLSTGLFVPELRALDPVWPSIAEYLAAGRVARDWDPQRWITIMAETSQRGLGRYALARAS